MSFYNTTSETGEALVKARRKTNAQELLVMEFFKGGGIYTTMTVYNQLLGLRRINNRTPIQSIRRAITDLKKAGYLVKLPKKRKEILGSPNYFYQRKEAYEKENRTTE